MSNTLTNLIPVLYEGLDIVAREMVGFIPAVDINASAQSAALNQTIRVPVTPAATTGDITPGQYPVDDGDQTISYTDMSITKSKYSPIRWNGEEIMGFAHNGNYKKTLADQFAQSVRALTNLVEVDLWTAAKNGASRAYGTAGTTPFGTSAVMTDVAQVRKILEDNGCPMSDMHMILGTTAAANLRGIQAGLFRANEAGTDSLLRQGTIGMLEGFNVGVSAAVTTHTKGTGASYVTSGSTAAGVSDIALVTGTGTVLAGDVVTFAADSTNKYVVGTGVAAPGTISLNKPGALVTIATANALTVGNTYTGNMVFERNAIKLLARSPAMPEGGDDADDVIYITDPVSGLTFQIAMYRLYRRVKYEVGLAWGVKALKTEFIATLLG